MATKSPMDMYYPILILQTAIIGFYAGIIVYIHIGVGFGVAIFY